MRRKRKRRKSGSGEWVKASRSQAGGLRDFDQVPMVGCVCNFMCN